MKKKKQAPIVIANQTVNPGEKATLILSAPELYTNTPVNIPLHIIHGKKPGQKLFVSATIHGDEINGIEIIRRLLKLSIFNRIQGTLIAIPIVNAYGFLNRSRYMPDRRDLNRSFPGSQKGSLTARLAHIFMTEIVSKCHYGIDIHSGTMHRKNLPQIRINLDTRHTIELAKAFATPVILDATLRDGSLRQAATEIGIPVMVYEAGEALRFDEIGIRMGIQGIIGVMRYLKMLPDPHRIRKQQLKPFVAHSSVWVRAPQSGLIQSIKNLGDQVNQDEALGAIVDPFGYQQMPFYSPLAGIIIGKSNLPLAQEGDALFHIASFKKPDVVAAQIGQLQQWDIG